MIQKNVRETAGLVERAARYADLLAEHEVAVEAQPRETPQEEAARRFRGDRRFIVACEGGLSTCGYTLEKDGKPIGNSGVTIGAGVDLGHQTEEGLRALGVGEGILAKTRLYLGKVREEANEYLAANPLFLRQDEARELTDRIHNGIIGDMARRYERRSGCSFYALPDEAQTVIADVAIQYGANLAERTPRFWGAVTRGDWNSALAELRDFRDGYRSRRLTEAARLNKAMDRERLA